MRRVTDHIVQPAMTDLVIKAVDGPGAGGASHLYQITGPGGSPMGIAGFNFQNGPIQEVGVNGITQEALIAVCIDRLRAFQAGPFSCRENALALTHLQDAMHWLHHRTLDRLRRGVEGYTKT